MRNIKKYHQHYEGEGGREGEREGGWGSEGREGGIWEGGRGGGGREVGWEG